MPFLICFFKAAEYIKKYLIKYIDMYMYLLHHLILVQELNI
jgi:hypothetical protein